MASHVEMTVSRGVARACDSEVSLHVNLTVLDGEARGDDNVRRRCRCEKASLVEVTVVDGVACGGDSYR